MRSERAAIDTGATMVEYALGIAFVVVVLITSLQFLNDEAGETVNESEPRIGSPVDEQFYPAGGATSGGTSSGGTTSPPSATPEVQAVTATPPPSNDANKWIASATVTVTDGSNPVAGVVVTGTWTVPGIGSTTTVSCPTDATGTCSVQRNDINDNRTQAVFTVTTLTLDGVDTIPPDPKPSVTVDCTTVAGVCQ